MRPHHSKRQAVGNDAGSKLFNLSLLHATVVTCTHLRGLQAGAIGEQMSTWDLHSTRYHLASFLYALIYSL